EAIAKRKKRRNNWTRLERCSGPHFQPAAYSAIAGTVNCDSTVNPLSRQNSSRPVETSRLDVTVHSGLAPRNNARIFRVVLLALPPLVGAMTCKKLFTTSPISTCRFASGSSQVPRDSFSRTKSCARVQAEVLSAWRYMMPPRWPSAWIGQEQRRYL